MIFNRARSLRFGIFFSFLVALLPVLIFIAVAVEMFLVPLIGTNARQELTNSTHLLTNSIRAGASVAVRNHLKAIAEKNREIASHHLTLVEQGLLSQEEAISRLRAILLSQQIGTSGYIYCLNSQGLVVIHPSPNVEGTDQTHFAFVREQTMRKEGYIEYEWQNPGEGSPRSKALYMVYFEPLNWIISVSSYKAEFNELVDIDDFRDAVLSLRFGESGYAYVINQDGETLIHPKLSDYSALLVRDPSTEFVRTMIDSGSGSLEYQWRNPDELGSRRKIAVYESIPEYGWTIVSSSYLEEVMTPVKATQKIAYFAILMLLIAAGLASYFLSGRLTRPVDAMIRQLDKNARNTVREPLPVFTDNELGRLAGEFNTFLETIDAKNAELERERERYQSLFETSPDAVFLLKGLTLIDCNPATLSIFASDKQSLIGRTIFELSPLYQRNGLSSADLSEEITEQVVSYTLQTFEWIHKRTDGQQFDAEVRLKPFGMENGKPLLVAFVRDITDRKKTEDALRQSELQYRQLIENASDAIFIAQGGRIVFTNNKTPLLTEYCVEELKSMAFSDFIHKDDRHMVVDRHTRRLGGEAGLQATYSFKIITKNNSERIVLLSTVLIDWDGQPATLNFVRDITEQKKLEAVLQQAQKMDAIGTLAGGIAHDFNNILMGILGRVSLLTANENQVPSETEHLQAIEEYVQSAASLTRQLLGFARGGKYQPVPVDLNELVVGSAEMFGRTKKELEVHTNIADTSVVSEVDQQQIEQVLLNMYVNAWQAMPGGGNLYLRSSTETLEKSYCKSIQAEPGKYAKISVTDSGVGMDESTQQRIFDPFFTTKEKGRGTGLGLASAYGIVKNHGGFITVYSELGHGSTFNIYLPLSGKQPSIDTPKVTAMLKGSERILLVDDEQMIIEVAQAMLHQLGYKVTIASSGERAIAIIKAETEQIDLIILDMIMPGLDGGSTFDMIRDLRPSLPVILSSGYSVDGQATNILQRGCNDFIQKPFNLSELSRKIRQVIDI